MHTLQLVMGSDQNLRETSMNVNSRFNIFGNREIYECQFSLFFMILSEQFANFCRISRVISKIKGIGSEGYFTIHSELT